MHRITAWTISICNLTLIFDRIQWRFEVWCISYWTYIAVSERIKKQSWAFVIKKRRGLFLNNFLQTKKPSKIHNFLGVQNWDKLTESTGKEVWLVGCFRLRRLYCQPRLLWKFIAAYKNLAWTCIKFLTQENCARFLYSTRFLNVCQEH